MATLLRPAARLAHSPDVLASIAADDCNLAIWQRAAFADFAPLSHGAPTDLRFACGPDELPVMLRARLIDHGFGGDSGLHELLIADAARLSALFCSALGLARFELRLEVVRTDSCRKFHADHVRARLITTYAGDGTDWLDDADAARVAAGEEPQQINRMNTFDVGLFKGKLASDHPAIHRSPPIAGTGAKRLLMVLNPAHKLFVDSGQSGVS